MDCPSCTYPIEEGASVCSHCGWELTVAPVSPANDPVNSFQQLPLDAIGVQDNVLTTGLPTVDLPQVDLPTIDLSTIDLPNVDLPNVDLPVVDLPEMQNPDEPSATEATQTRQADFSDGDNPFSLELDTLLPLQENVGNSLRFLFSPLLPGKAFLDVELSLTSEDESFQRRVKKRAFISTPHEFPFNLRNLKPGVCVCEISISYTLDGRRYHRDGTAEVVILNESDQRSEAGRSLSFLNNSLVRKMKEDSSYLRVSITKLAESVLKSATVEARQDPLKTLSDLINLGARRYRKITMYRSDGIEVLQRPPQEAVCKEIQLDFGYGFGKIQLFTDQIIGIGHTYDGNRYTDIIVDPPCGLDEAQRLPYEKMSRGQCVLRSNVNEVELVDGRYRSSGSMSESTNGTYLNGENIGKCGRRVLETGCIIGLGTTSRETTLDVELVTPKADSCRHCRLGGESREYCCRSGCASTNVVLRRRDGVAIVYVALWSCIDVGSIYRSFSGLEIFYDNQAFAWRQGTKRGWIVPGGKIELSHFRPIIVSPIWDETRRLHSKNQGITKKGDAER